eukprot:CAMPEP_0172325168 /NCGR_PEP_ID=MMETSP1058-20130122/53289_1 /TAXON_ID=83371 /ORGANISM="Detonula confervacea, Strain CCMP 353" /LENGTH=356 /DNA_ID=CAMNT_0013041639 /DNA_START=56 /DNA_END=1126 /DNA_ORIENTATION=+
MNPSRKRKLIVALVFVAASLHHMIFHGGDTILQLQQPQLDSRNTTSIDNTISRLQYIRPPGHKEELLGMFEELSDPSSYRWQQLPKTPKDIAQKYGIPETSRDLKCNANGATTTVGWIPSESSYYNVSAAPAPFTHSGRIPRLIFQSWKTNQLKEELCNHVLVWSKMNPEYDYFLFDDDAVDNFIRLEYGKETFSAFACVKVGAAKCDVWRLLVIYLFGGLYFDFDNRLATRLADWNWGDRDVVTGRSCNAPRKHPGGCAHQWGLVYAPKHPVLYASIRETLSNLAERKATHVYDISFWSYYNGWRQGPYNQSYMPGWGDRFGGRVLFQDDEAKDLMVEGNTHWQKQKQMWYPECM